MRELPTVVKECPTLICTMHSIHHIKGIRQGKEGEHPGNLLCGKKTG